MKKITALIALLVIALFIIPAHAKKPKKLLGKVEVVNDTTNPVPIQGDVEVINTLDVNVTNTDAIPVSVTIESPCCTSIKGAASEEGLVAYDPGTGNVAQATYDLVTLAGPGTFISARLTKQGGATGLTAVSLSIDGKTVVQRNIVALKNWGMTQNNPFGVVVFTSPVGIDAVTIGFSQPIAFKQSLVLSAIVGEPGVIQIIGTIIYGE